MPDTDPEPVQPRPPDAKTVERAASVLQFELGLLHDAINNLDRKAALIAPFLVAAAAFLLGPVGTAYSWPQTILVATAVVLGIWSGWESLRAMSPDDMQFGPRAEMVEKHTWASQAAFDQRVVEALTRSVQQVTRTTFVKGQHIGKAMRLAGVTLLFLVLARLAGGIAVTDDPGGGTPTQAPASAPASDAPAPASAPASAPATPAATAAPAPATSESLPSFGDQLGSFGEQTAQRGALPSFETQIAAKGSDISPETQKIIEKGG